MDIYRIDMKPIFLVLISLLLVGAFVAVLWLTMGWLKALTIVVLICGISVLVGKAIHHQDSGYEDDPTFHQ